MDINTMLNVMEQTMSINISIPTFSTFLVAYGGEMREGMSVSRVTSNVISRQSEFGGPTSNEFDSGTPNMMNNLIAIICEEVLKEIRTYGRIEVGSQNNALQVSVQGANAGGPFVAFGSNYMTGKSYGILV